MLRRRGGAVAAVAATATAATAMAVATIVLLCWSCVVVAQSLLYGPDVMVDGGAEALTPPSLGSGWTKNPDTSANRWRSTVAYTDHGGARPQCGDQLYEANLAIPGFGSVAGAVQSAVLPLGASGVRLTGYVAGWDSGAMGDQTALDLSLHFDNASGPLVPGTALVSTGWLNPGRYTWAPIQLDVLLPTDATGSGPLGGPGSDAWWTVGQIVARIEMKCQFLAGSYCNGNVDTLTLRPRFDRANMSSAAPPVLTCPQAGQMGSTCGTPGDGAGGTLSCGSCGLDEQCLGDELCGFNCVCDTISCPTLACDTRVNNCTSRTCTCPSNQDYSCSAGTCVCDAAVCPPDACNTFTNGCGNTAMCSCGADRTCNATAPALGTCLCDAVPASVCAVSNGTTPCGVVTNACGGSRDCGPAESACPLPNMTCTGNECVCDPALAVDWCGTRQCGDAYNLCGNSVSCGPPCSGGLECNAMGFCACPVIPCETPAGIERCGLVASSCASAHCGSCSYGVCNNVTHECECTPQHTCASLGVTCGTVNDGCGTTLACGDPCTDDGGDAAGDATATGSSASATPFLIPFIAACVVAALCLLCIIAVFIAGRRGKGGGDSSDSGEELPSPPLATTLDSPTNYASFTSSPGNAHSPQKPSEYASLPHSAMASDGASSMEYTGIPANLGSPSPGNDYDGLPATVIEKGSPSADGYDALPASVREGQ